MYIIYNTAVMLHVYNRTTGLQTIQKQVTTNNGMFGLSDSQGQGSPNTTSFEWPCQCVHKYKV